VVEKTKIYKNLRSRPSINDQRLRDPKWLRQVFIYALPVIDQI
jgi:hypothetical protein